MPAARARFFMLTGLGHAATRDSHGGSEVTGMLVTVRVADSGVWGTFPKAKPLFSAPQAKKILGPKCRFTDF